MNVANSRDHERPSEQDQAPTGPARLQEEGLIMHHRGMVEILDRDRLEAKACECLPVYPWQPYPASCPASLRPVTGIA